MTTTLAVFRARQAVSQASQQDCYAACGTRQDIQLIKLSIKTGHPCLIGLDGQTTIIKPAESGDEALSFEALYDNCYTVADLDRMQHAGVEQPSEMPLVVHRMEAQIAINVICRRTIALRAQNPSAAVTSLRELWETDVMFRASLAEEILSFVAGYLDHPDVPFRVRESTADPHRPLDPPLDPNGPPWRILDED